MGNVLRPTPHPTLGSNFSIPFKPADGIVDQICHIFVSDPSSRERVPGLDSKPTAPRHSNQVPVWKINMLDRRLRCKWLSSVTSRESYVNEVKSVTHERLDTHYTPVSLDRYSDENMQDQYSVVTRASPKKLHSGNCLHRNHSFFS